MRALVDCYVYGILDLGYVEMPSVVTVAEDLLESGIDILQLRAKGESAERIAELGEKLLTMTRKRGIALVINDLPEVAKAIGADGVHVGQDDLSVDEARALSGGKCFVGKSTHSLDQAVAAQKEGADYIGFGPLFPTPTKPDYPAIGVHDIDRAHELVSLPIFCIGGIKRENVADVRDRGARRVVIVSGLLQAQDRAAYVDEVKTILSSPRS